MPETDLTTKKKKLFLKFLAECGNVSKACESAELSRPTVYRHKKEDTAFAEAWDEAESIYVDSLEAEADRRGRDGVSKPIFYQGQQVGETREYSDNLLMFRLKALRPDKYRERQTKNEDTNVVGVKYIAGVSEDDL